MLNLYLAPRNHKGSQPAEEAVDAALRHLQDAGILGDFADHAWAPGQDAARLFHEDAASTLLPAELTFDALAVELVRRARFLPENHAAGFPGAVCQLCGDDLHADGLDAALAKLRYVAVDRFELRCPSCRNDLTLRDVDFGQPIAVARFWFFIEGAATARLNAHQLDPLSRLLGMPMVVVPEVPAERIEDWVPARRRRQGG